MHALVDLYRRHQNVFLLGEPSWVVSAVWRGQIALPSQKAMIVDTLKEINRTPATAYYLVITEPASPSTGKGTIFIDGRGNGFPAIYVEDQLIAGPPPTP